MPENVENMENMSSAEILAQIETQSGEEQYDAANENVLVVNEEGNLVPKQGPAGADKPQENKGGDSTPAPKTVTKSQEELNREFATVRKKAEKKYAPDVALAGRVRSYFEGKDDAAIQEMLISLAASEQAKAKNIPEPVARELLNLRNAQKPAAVESEADDAEPTVEQTAQEHPPNTRNKELAAEAQEISDQYGVDMMQVLAGDQELARKIFEQNWSMYRALSDYQAKSGGKQTQRAAAPTVRAPNRSPSTGIDVSKMSDAQFNAIKEKVRKGYTVEL